jgi:hypothetical protein
MMSPSVPVIGWGNEADEESTWRSLCLDDAGLPTAAAVRVARGAGRSGVHLARGTEIRIESEVASAGGRFPAAWCPQPLSVVRFFVARSSARDLVSHRICRPFPESMPETWIRRVTGTTLPHSRYGRGVEVSAGSASIRSTTASGAIRGHRHAEIDPRRNNHEIKFCQ